MKNENKYLSIKELLMGAENAMIQECVDDCNDCNDCKYGKIITGNKSICDAHTDLYAELVMGAGAIWND